MTKIVFLLLLFSTGLAEDDIVVEVEDEPELLPVFHPTNEWQEVARDQSIPAGLHVRINLKTGLREAKLLETKDQHRVHHYGHSDRRGIVNKQSKVFTQEEYKDMLQADELVQSSYIPALTHVPTNQQHSSSHPLTFTPHLPVTLHHEVVDMMTLISRLTDVKVSDEELVSVLDELEYHVHEIKNGIDLEKLGGVPVLLRLLNHTDPKVISQAALVLGSAAQGNPVVQDSVVMLDGVSLVCGLLSRDESDLVLRRALFALGALLRGTHLYLISKCHQFDQLRSVFQQLSNRVKLKVATLVSDMATELGNEWCQQVSFLLYSESLALIEVGLSAMMALKCNCTDHLNVLMKLSHQFGDMSNTFEDIQSLLSYIQQGKEL